jgi:cytochrome c oxidase assembly protein subunit 15
VRIPDRLRVPPSAVQGLALASVAANVLLVVTGGAVRLTGSGLGCPTWPRCTDGSYHNTAAYGIHGYVEFGNRLLGVAIGILVTLVFLAAVLARDESTSLLGARGSRRRAVLGLALLNGASIPAQAVVGGLTVLTKLNPWVVAAHFLLSPAIIAVGYLLWRRTGQGDGPARPVVPGPLRALAWLIAGVTVAVLAAGTVVTGSGPHAGDAHAKRTGLDPATVAQLHADLVCLLIGLSVALWFAVRALRPATPAGADGPAGAGRGAVGGLVARAGWLIVIELGQGAIGFVQYFTHLPDLLVGAHMAGACAVWLAALSVLFATRYRGPAPATEPGPATGPALAPAG